MFFEEVDGIFAEGSTSEGSAFEGSISEGSSTEGSADYFDVTSVKETDYDPAEDDTRIYDEDLETWISFDSGLFSILLLLLYVNCLLYHWVLDEF